LGSQVYPVADKDLIKNTERALKWTLVIGNDLKPVWSCTGVLVDIQDKPFAKGSCRSAHKLRDLTHPDQSFVGKFSTKKASRDQYFMDVVMQTFCSKWADLYNSFNPPKKISFLPSFVLELFDRPTGATMCGGEPFIEGDYKKFNNNSGYVNNDESTGVSRNTPQAFSHFSLKHSNHELVIIDIQGVNDFYTDPQIHTKSGKGFGEGNLGQNGIYQFIKTHHCNPLCQFLKLEPLNASTKRMLLRGTLPVVTLEFNKDGVVARGEGGGVLLEEDEEDDEEYEEDAAAFTPAKTRSPNRNSGSVPHPLQPSAAPSPPVLKKESSWLASQAPPAEGVQNPLQPKAATDSAVPTTPTNGHAAEASPAALTAPAASGGGGGGGGGADEASDPAPAPEPVWDLKAFKLLDTVRGCQSECIVADEKILYTGSSEGSIGVWDPKELKHVGNFKTGHSKAVKSLVLHKGALFSAGSDAVIKEWDIEQQKVLNEAKDKGDTNAICLQDTSLFSASNDKTVKIWDTRTYKCTATLTAHTRAVKCLYVLGNYLFSGSNDQQILVWSLQTNSVLTNLQGHEGWIKSLAGTKNTLFSGSHDETIRVWDLKTLQCTNTLKAKDKVEAILPTPQALFSASGDYLEIWDSNKFTIASSTNARTSILCLARYGPRIFCGSIGNHLKVWSCEQI